MTAAASTSEPFTALRSPVLASSVGPSSSFSPPPSPAAFRPRPVLFSSVVLLVLQAMQFGWSITQLNFSQFHTQRLCDARPVAPGTCLMFPGHTKTEWLYVVNLWLVGGMLGSIVSGRISDRIGRKRTHLGTCVMSIVAGSVQTTAPSLPVFTLGRFLAGVGTGVTSSLINGYINELSPPHLRNALGITFQISRGVGCISCGLMFFLTASPNGWRYISAVPIGLGAIGLLLAPKFMVESPPWLLTRGRREDAEVAIATLFGEERVQQALAWMDAATQAAGRSKSIVAPLSRSTSRHDVHEVSVVVEPSNRQAAVPPVAVQEQDPGKLTVSSPWRALFSSTFRAQTALAVALCSAQQLSGINAVFLYSSTTFKDAGLNDDRIGVLVINIFNLVPTMFAGSLGTRMGNRPLLLWGHVGMILCAVGITAALMLTSAPLSVVFMAAFVGVYAVTLGPLPFVIAPSVFPDALRATGSALCICANWGSCLVIGVGFPYIASALEDYGFVPFIVVIAAFGAYTWRHLPETAGLTGEEIQEIYRQRKREQQR
ncbi:hypothetical protein P43SY_005222 [Pythium insidiosum]|uniref:Hexose transporter 1 n=1 Tax=Pythium insidiosum TaxID=114742 RepID=A0AAD5LND8_PYTIN|nr:hypothetical protein P43SY_005222 [Pythium insidiosum]